MKSSTIQKFGHICHPSFIFWSLPMLVTVSVLFLIIAEVFIFLSTVESRTTIINYLLLWLHLLFLIDRSQQRDCHCIYMMLNLFLRPSVVFYIKFHLLHTYIVRSCCSWFYYPKMRLSAVISLCPLLQRSSVGSIQFWVTNLSTVKFDHFLWLLTGCISFSDILLYSSAYCFIKESVLPNAFLCPKQIVSIRCLCASWLFHRTPVGVWAIASIYRNITNFSSASSCSFSHWFHFLG